LFTVGYLLVVILALTPAALSYASTGRTIPSRRAMLFAAIILGIACFEAALRISLEYYWFTELGKTHRYLLSLEYRVALFFGVLMLAGWFVGSNVRALCRPVWPFGGATLWIIPLVFSILLAMLATSLWIPLMAYFGATATGITDPVFGKDLSFYLLELPLYQDVTAGLIVVLPFTLVVWGALICFPEAHKRRL
jgi:uncharacterized membrane protein (UPF0182 family)